MFHPLPERWVPKTHPLDRDCEPDDPLELMGSSMPGDPAVMLDCVLQEFAWMGYNADQLMSLFDHPGYPVLWQLRERFGHSEVRRRVEALVEQWGVLRFHETVVDTDGAAAPRLFQIQLPGAARPPQVPGNDSAQTRGV